jgi:hypothetical protein
MNRVHGYCWCHSRRAASASSRLSATVSRSISSQTATRQSCWSPIHPAQLLNCDEAPVDVGPKSMRLTPPNVLQKELLYRPAMTRISLSETMLSTSRDPVACQSLPSRDFHREDGRQKLSNVETLKCEPMHYRRQSVELTERVNDFDTPGFGIYALSCGIDSAAFGWARASVPCADPGR